MLQEHAENLKRLFLELQFDSTPAQLARSNVYLENAEAKDLRKLRLNGHYVPKVYTRK
jgi:hypothetical protein